MKKLICLAAVALAAATLPAHAASAERGAAAVGASEGQSRQQNRMASCNKEAVGKKGDERRAFMKQCLSSNGGKTAGEGRSRRSKASA